MFSWDVVRHTEALEKPSHPCVAPCLGSSQSTTTLRLHNGCGYHSPHCSGKQRVWSSVFRRECHVLVIVFELAKKSTLMAVQGPLFRSG